VPRRIPRSEEFSDILFLSSKYFPNLMSDHRRPSRTDRRRSRSPNDSRHNYHDDREFGDFFFNL
jgi:hypothetical protein